MVHLKGYIYISFISQEKRILRDLLSKKQADQMSGLFLNMVEQAFSTWGNLKNLFASRLIVNLKLLFLLSRKQGMAYQKVREVLGAGLGVYLSMRLWKCRTMLLM